MFREQFLSAASSGPLQLPGIRPEAAGMGMWGFTDKFRFVPAQSPFAGVGREGREIGACPGDRRVRERSFREL